MKIKRSSWHYKLLRRNYYYSKYFVESLSPCSYVFNVFSLCLLKLFKGLFYTLGACLVLAIFLLLGHDSYHSIYEGVESFGSTSLLFTYILFGILTSIVSIAGVVILITIPYLLWTHVVKPPLQKLSNLKICKRHKITFKD